jgi:cation:H+ antiporter
MQARLASKDLARKLPCITTRIKQGRPLMLDLSTWPLWANIITFLGAAGIIAWAGTKLAAFGDRAADRTGLGEAITGMMFLGFTTALPGRALTLAVSDIVGGNFFDVLFVFAADLVYLQGSLYHTEGVGVREVFLTSLAILLNITLLLGLLM